VGTTEWLPGDDIALMAAALEERFLKRSAPPVVTTTYTRVSPYTRSTTPYFRQAFPWSKGPLFTSQTSRASSAPTSSNTPRSDGSLYYLNFKAIDGWAERTYADADEANDAYNEAVLLYRFVTLTLEETVVTKQIVRDSTKETP